MPSCPRHPVENEVLRLIKPSEGERREAERVASLLVREVSEAVSSILGGEQFTVKVEGSLAKDTWLSGDLDFDIFILFDKDKCTEIIGEKFANELAEKLRERGYTVELSYAAHPYVKVLVDGYWADVVPACRIERGERPLTPVDRTPLHTEYVKSKLTGEQRDEVRLLKSFMKGIGVYGAEIAVEGFSGYLAELLIAYYGCFRKALEAISSWKPPTIIDIESYYNDARMILRFFGKDKPLIVVDPVDPKRNVAAAVSARSYAKIILASKLYLTSPSRNFYHVEPFKLPKTTGRIIANLEARLGNIIVIKLEPTNKPPPDVLWGIGKRIAKIVESYLERWGFNVFSIDVTACTERRILIAVELAARTLPRYELLRGPPAWLREHATRFYLKYASDPTVFGPWVGDDGRLYVVRPRRYVEAITLLSERRHEWLPQSLQSYRIHVKTIMEVDGELEECEKLWATRIAVRMEEWELRRNSM